MNFMFSKGKSVLHINDTSTHLLTTPQPLFCLEGKPVLAVGGRYLGSVFKHFCAMCIGYPIRSFTDRESV